MFYISILTVHREMYVSPAPLSHAHAIELNICPTQESYPNWQINHRVLSNRLGQHRDQCLGCNNSSFEFMLLLTLITNTKEFLNFVFIIA